VLIARDICGIEYKSRRLVLQLQSAKASRTVTSSWTISVNVMKGSKIPRIELNTVHLYQHYSLYMPNKLLYTWRGDYCECVRPAQLPILIEVRAPSLLEQYPQYVPHQDRAGYNTMNGLGQGSHLVSRCSTTVPMGLITFSSIFNDSLKCIK